jgi:hypothetical protein
MKLSPIASFYGMRIYMRRRVPRQPYAGELPHVGVRYGRHGAHFAIKDGKLLGCSRFPPTGTQLVRQWLYIHRSQLIRIWRNPASFVEIEPLL